MKYYVLDENKNMHEAYTKEDIVALLEKVIADGSLESIEEDTAFVSKIKSLVSGGTYHIDFVTQTKYNELQATGQILANCYYFITDDTTEEDFETALESLETRLQNAETRLDNLGFKEGAFVLVSGGSASTNTLTKEGNRVIASYGGSPVSLESVCIPSDFRPEEQTICSCYGLIMNGSIPSVISQVVINTNGTIQFKASDTIYEKDALLSIELYNIAWEV